MKKIILIGLILICLSFTISACGSSYTRSLKTAHSIAGQVEEVESEVEQVQEVIEDVDKALDELESIN